MTVTPDAIRRAHGLDDDVLDSADADGLMALFDEAPFVTFRQLLERVQREADEDAREQTRHAISQAGLA